MNQEFSSYELTLLILIAIIYWRLWASLQPPQNGKTARSAGHGDGPTLSSRVAAGLSPKATLDERWEGIAEPGSEVARGLSAIQDIGHAFGFEAHHFLNGAHAAYKTIVTACARGDRGVLENLLSPDVYAAFSVMIAEREERGERVELRFVSVAVPEIVEAGLSGNSAQITLRFVSRIVTTTQTTTGKTIGGHGNDVVEVNDLWTFAHEISSRDPDWKLVATEAG